MDMKAGVLSFIERAKSDLGAVSLSAPKATVAAESVSPRNESAQVPVLRTPAPVSSEDETKSSLVEKAKASLPNPVSVLPEVGVVAKDKVRQVRKFFAKTTGKHGFFSKNYKPKSTELSSKREDVAGQASSLGPRGSDQTPLDVAKSSPIRKPIQRSSLPQVPGNEPRYHPEDQSKAHLPWTKEKKPEEKKPASLAPAAGKIGPPLPARASAETQLPFGENPSQTIRPPGPPFPPRTMSLPQVDKVPPPGNLPPNQQTRQPIGPPLGTKRAFGQALPPGNSEASSEPGGKLHKAGSEPPSRPPADASK